MQQVLCVLLLLDTGWVVGDAVIGRYLNPRILNIDIKMFFLFNIGMLGHMAMCAVMFVETYHRDKVNAAMILLVSYAMVDILAAMAYQVR